MIKPTNAAPRTLSRRLLPLQVGVALQGLILWVPIEKLFMTQIGFDAASVGVMAAAYAAVVPLLEVPSGILADRWSRSRVMILGCLALVISTLLGGLSQNVLGYVIAAMVLGIYFAFSSGTVDSVVYDTVLEETGSNELYETWIGRVRAVESAAFVLSSLAGGVLAQYTSTRFTYFATIPLVGLAIIGFLRFNEPRLHQAAERVTLRSHIALTFRTMITSGPVFRVLLLVAAVRIADPGRLRVWATLAGRACRAGRAVWAVLGGAGVDPWCGRIAGRQATPGASTDAGDVDHLVISNGTVADLDPLASNPDDCSGCASTGPSDHRNPCQQALARCGAVLHQGRRVIRRRDDDLGAVLAFFAGVRLDGSAERRSLVRIHVGRRCRSRRRAARRQRSG